MADDDRDVMERLAALEAEVKADADAQARRKDAAMTRLRDQRAAKEAEQAAERDRAAAKSSVRMRRARDDDDDGDGIRGAIELASKANRVKNELAKKGAKSWAISGVASLAAGPLGWLYAGSFREAIPASAAWLLVATLLSKIGLPAFLLMPILLVALPLSGIAGIVYALQYNKTGKRQRLFGPDPGKKKELPAGK